MKVIQINIENKFNQVENSFVDLYNEATEDYEFWSSDFNMHFGYYIPFKTNLFKRDSMLNEMNNQVFKRLRPKENQLTVDLGCGMGGTMRYGLNKFKKTKIFGITLSDFQVKEGNKLLQNENGLILKEDYINTSFKSNSINGAYAIESFCHSGHDINAFKEAYRILKPKGRFVITDAFLKKEIGDLCLGSAYAYKQLCKGWDLKSLGTITTIEKQMKEIGFKNICIEDVSFKVAPSVLHVPFAITGFILKKIFKKETLKPQSLSNLKGSLFALISGLHMKSFGYYIISATK